MTNNCTYLKNAKTLPKNSILFSKYLCLNELNNIKINGEQISIPIKKAIFESVYLNNKPTIKNIAKFLVDNKYYEKGVKITGVDINLTGNMSSYLTYKRILGDKVDKYPDMVERCIFFSTIHNDSKMIEESIVEEFVNDKKLLTMDEVKSLKGIKYNGWGAFSREFLDGANIKNGLKLCDVHGEYILSIIDILYNSNQSLQQILFDPKYKFEDAKLMYYLDNGIAENSDISYEDIKEMYCSPSVKRVVWQALGLVEDLIKNTKVIPDKVFIESPRSNTDSKKNERTKSRRDIVVDYYNEAVRVANEKRNMDQLSWIKDGISNCTNKLNNITDDKLASERYYLYFMQLGKCAYTGLPIDFDSIPNKNCYDVDHIIPQCKVKDDSLNNKVLVCQNANKEKSDRYPVPIEYRQKTLWNALYSSKLMSESKYVRLTRITEITPEEQEKFVNRQLVETSQITMLVRDILDRYFKLITDKKVELVLSRATNVSEFRKAYHLTKSRDVNDFHHAIDAYLNVVVGNILNQQFNHNYKRVFDNGQDKSFNFAKTLERKVLANDKELLTIIKNEINTNKINISKKLITGKGELYKATIFPASDNDSLIPLKQSKIINGKELQPKCDTSKYGGYKTSGTAYFVIVDSYDKKGKKIRSIENISIFDNVKLSNGLITMEQILLSKGYINPHLAKINGLKNAVLKVGSLIDFGSYKLRLVGANEREILFHNANQLYVNEQTNDYIKEISMCIEKVNKLCAKEREDKEGELERALVSIIEKNTQRLKKANQTNEITIINKEKNIQIYELLINKLSTNPYKNIPRYSSLVNILTLAFEDFVNKSLYIQIKVINNILHAFQCNALKVDVSNLSYFIGNVKKNGGANQCGISSSKILSNKDIYFVSQSKSGIKENRIKIMSKNFGK